MPSIAVVKRQYIYYNYYADNLYWIRWIIIGGIFLLLAIVLLLAYLHARRRMNDGQQPMAYHAWMIPYRQRAHFYETGYINNPGYQVPLSQYPHPPPPIYAGGYPPNQAYWQQPNNYQYPLHEPPTYGEPQPQKH